TPATLIVGVDNNGNLYTCSASVGDAALQNTLQQALNSSFGEQAGMCQFTVQEGVANNIANMPIEALPNILTLLRATPFARLQLQNDRMTIEAPDGMQLQRLTTEIRTLAPAIMVDSTAPLPLPNSAENGIGADNMAMNAANNQFAQDGSSINDQYAGTNNMNNSNANNNNDYQASDDITGDSVTPAPARNSDFNNPPRANEPRNNEPRNNEPRNNEPRSIDRPASTRPPGPFSESEVDDMANSVIVAEPARVR